MFTTESQITNQQINTLMRLLFLCLIVVFAGCHVTTWHSKSPEFDNKEQLDRELKQLVPAEYIEMKGRTTSVDTQTSTLLLVDITNGEHIPQDDAARTALSRSIAAAIRRHLKDPKAFDNYEISYITQIITPDMNKQYMISDKLDAGELE